MDSNQCCESMVAVESVWPKPLMTPSAPIWPNPVLPVAMKPMLGAEMVAVSVEVDRPLAPLVGGVAKALPANSNIADKTTRVINPIHKGFL